jgi:beta-lactamase regulating signal transducer with metallopeptidase domain
MTSVLTAALLHFLWQGLLVFVLLRAALFFLRDRSANARYAASCAALALMALAPAITVAILYRPPTALSLPIAATAIALPAATLVRSASWTAALRPWILPVWAFGVAICSLRMLWACAQVAALRRRSAPAAAAIQETIADLSRRLGVTRRARVLISTWTGGPSVIGWLRPVILLPVAAIAGLTSEQLEAVLAHELAHIRRHDYLVNWLQIGVETLLFYHPAVWWISSRIREERELCCDDLAVRACAAPVCYARALTVLEKMRGATPATALASTGGPLLYRIQRIVGATASPYGPSRASAIVAVILAIAFLGATVHWTRAQTQPTQDYLRAGDTLLRAGSNEQALEKYREGMERHPEDRVTYQKRTIETLMRMNRKADAYAVNDDILQNHPDDTDALTLRAAGLVDRGDTAEAIRILQSVLERVPENPVAHLNLGLAFAAQKQLESARQEMDEALRLRRDFTRAQGEREGPGVLSEVPPEPAAEFLIKELNARQLQLERYRQKQDPESQAMARELERIIIDLQHRLTIPDTANFARIQREVRERQLEQAKAAGDREKARQLEAQVEHLQHAQEASLNGVRSQVARVEAQLQQARQQDRPERVKALELQIEYLRRVLSNAEQRLQDGK